MKIKKKFTCDYCEKTFVTSKFFKDSHKNTVKHQLNRGKYYEAQIQEQKVLSMRRLRRLKARQDQQNQTQNENIQRQEEELNHLENTCPHIEVFGNCNYQQNCKNNYVRIKRLPTAQSQISKIGKWKLGSKLEKLRYIQTFFVNKKRLIMLKYIREKMMKDFGCSNTKELFLKVPPSMMPAIMYSNYFSSKLGSKDLKQKIDIENLIRVQQMIGWNI